MTESRDGDRLMSATVYLLQVSGIETYGMRAVSRICTGVGRYRLRSRRDRVASGAVTLVGRGCGG